MKLEAVSLEPANSLRYDEHRVRLIGRATAMTHHERIEVNPGIMFGKPVVKGTRITVEQLLRKLASGMTLEQIIEEHPRLTVADVRAAEAFAADYLADEEVAFG